jgi:MFS family permease
VFLTPAKRRNGISYGWILLGACFFTLFVSTGARNGLGVFVVPMSDELDWNRTSLSLAISIGMLVNGISQPFLGRIFDRFGGRAVISASLSILGICTLLLNYTHSLWYFILIFSVVMSIATGGASMVTIHSLLARWFRRRRGIALSLGTAGGSAGALILVPFTNYLILAAGWRVTWTVLGGMILLLALPLAFLVIKDDPSDVGETPDGEPEPVPERKAKKPGPQANGPLEAVRWQDSYRTPPIWQMSGAYFVCGMTTAIISVHYVPFAIDRGLSSSTAALAFGLMSGLNVFGVIGAGAISDRLGRKYLLGTLYAVRGLAYAMLILAPASLGIWGFAIIAGFSWVATAPLTSSLTADIYGLRNLGTLNGMTTFAHQIGGALSVLMAGVLYDWLGAYDVPFAIAGVTLAGASIAAFSIKERKYSTRYQATDAAPAPLPHAG